MFDDFPTFDIINGPHQEDERENRFIQRMQELYGLSVIETGCSRADQTKPCQKSLRLIADLSRGKQKDPSLWKDIKVWEVLAPFAPTIRETEEMRQTAQTMIKEYLIAFDRSLDEIPGDWVVTVYDYADWVIGCLRPRVIEEIRTTLSPLCGVIKERIFYDYDPGFVILCLDERSYKKVLKRQEELDRVCYEAMKKQDTHGLVRPEDARVRVRLLADLTQNERVVYASRLCVPLHR